jgi:hypothetical protein
MIWPVRRAIGWWSMLGGRKSASAASWVLAMCASSFASARFQMSWNGQDVSSEQMAWPMMQRRQRRSGSSAASGGGWLRTVDPDTDAGSICFLPS